MVKITFLLCKIGFEKYLRNTFCLYICICAFDNLTLKQNIFDYRVAGKSTSELKKILKKRAGLHSELIDSAVRELKKRGIAVEKVSVKSKLKKDVNETTGFEENISQSRQWLTPGIIYNHFSITVHLGLIALILSFPYFRSYIFFIFLMVGAFIPLLFINGNSTKSNRRKFHLQSRALYAFGVIIIIVVRNRLLDGDAQDISIWISAWALTFILTGIVSVLIYHGYKHYSLLRIKSLWIFTHSWPFSLFLIVTLTGSQLNWLHPYGQETLQWDSDKPLNYDDFKGYPKLYSDFDAAIRSTVFGQYIDKNRLEVSAEFYPKYTWMNPLDKGNSYFLLQHEQYHFNITELYARLFRKSLLDSLDSFDEDGFLNELKAVKRRLSNYQDLYDLQTNHSVKSEQQSIWQFKVDSALMVLDMYFEPEIGVVKDEKIVYSRFLVQDGDLIPRGRGKVYLHELHKTGYYRFEQNDSSVNEINYFHSGSLSKDPYFGASIIKIIKSSDNERLISFFDNNGQQADNRFGHHLIKEIKKNRTFFYLFYDKDGNKAAGPTGESTSVVIRDTQGKMLEKYFLNKEGKRMRNILEQYHLRYYSSSSPTRISCKNYDESGGALADSNGYIEFQYEFDQSGNLVKEIKVKHPNLINFKSPTGFEETSYNRFGHRHSFSIFDENATPVENDEGIWKTIYSHDRYGFVNMKATYNSNGVLANDSEGVAMRFWNQDKNGTVTEFAEYDQGSRLVYDEDNYGKARYIYDENGKLTQYFDLNGYDYPINSIVFNYADDSINNKRITFYTDENGNRTSNMSGTYEIVNQYDDFGNILESRSLKRDGELNEDYKDVAIFKYDYDDKGNKIQTTYLNSRELPAYANQGAHINRYKYDEKGNLIERTYYDTLGNLVEFDGFAMLRWHYDSLNEILVKEFYDTKEVLIKRFKYLNKKVTVERSFLNQELDDSTSISITRYLYEGENLVTKIFFTNDSSQASNSEGVHIYNYAYNQKDQKISESYLGLSGEKNEVSGVAEIKYEYDQRGNISRLFRFNAEDELISPPKIAIETFSYNLTDKLLLHSFYSSNGRLLLKDGAYSAIKYERNASDDVERITYYDSLGKMTFGQDSIVQISYKYDRNGTVYYSDTTKYTFFEKSDSSDLHLIRRLDLD